MVFVDEFTFKRKCKTLNVLTNNSFIYRQHRCTEQMGIEPAYQKYFSQYAKSVAEYFFAAGVI